MPPQERDNIIQLFTSQQQRVDGIEKTLEEVANAMHDMALALGVLHDIKDELKSLKEELLVAATKNVPVSSIEELSKLHMQVIKMLCWVIGVMTVWFTGLKYIAPEVIKLAQ